MASTFFFAEYQGLIFTTLKRPCFNEKWRLLIFFFAKGISSHLWRNLGDCVSVPIYLKTQFGCYWVKISTGRLYHVSTLIYSNFIKYLAICFYMFSVYVPIRYNCYHVYLRLFSKTPILQKKRYGFYEKDSVNHKREKVKSFGHTFARKGFLIFSQRPLFSSYITKGKVYKGYREEPCIQSRVIRGNVHVKIQNW